VGWKVVQMERCKSRTGSLSTVAIRLYTNYGAVPPSNKPLTLGISLATFATDLKAAGVYL
jgi:hypothetical protein